MSDQPTTVTRTVVFADLNVPEGVTLRWGPIGPRRPKLTRRQQIRLSARARKRRRGW